MRVSLARLLLNLRGFNLTISSLFFSASSLSTGGWGDLALVDRKEMLTQIPLFPFRILCCFGLYTYFYALMPVHHNSDIPAILILQIQTLKSVTALQDPKYHHYIKKKHPKQRVNKPCYHKLYLL